MATVSFTIDPLSVDGEVAHADLGDLSLLGTREEDQVKAAVVALIRSEATSEADAYHVSISASGGGITVHVEPA